MVSGPSVTFALWIQTSLSRMNRFSQLSTSDTDYYYIHPDMSDDSFVKSSDAQKTSGSESQLLSDEAQNTEQRNY